MRMNDTKRENLGVHGVINVLLWYCQEIKGELKDSSFCYAKKEKEYETTEAYCCRWEAKASRL